MTQAPNIMTETKSMQEMEANPTQSIKGDPTKNADNPASSCMLALPAEIMFKILQDPSLSEYDLANIRLVCKMINLFATEAFCKKCFSGGLCLGFCVEEFERLAAIYSSSLHPFLESVHFVRFYNLTPMQAYTKDPPNYSALKNINFESSLNSADSSTALKELLNQAKQLETLSFSTARKRDGIHWNEQRIHRDCINERETRNREREQVDAILSKLKSDRLVELNLAEIIFTVRTFKALLERHSGTVRKLSIRGCGLRRGSCAGLLLWISQNLPCLEQIDLQYIYETAWGAFNPVVLGELVTTVDKESIGAYIAFLQKQDKS
ncbi:hypothetical protein KCU77_g3877, partial [Aureobasidium melanogenum]